MVLSNFHKWLNRHSSELGKKGIISRVTGDSWVIFLTGKCNLSCSYCFTKKKIGFDMPNEILVDAINFLNRNNVNHLRLWGGEPLEYPEGIKYVLNNSLAKSFSITTNGIYLTKEIFEELQHHRVGIALSFDGTKRSQDEGRNGSYDDIMKNIKEWLYLIKINGGQVLKTVNNPENLYADVKHIYELGFPRCFLNFYRPYGVTYSIDDIREIEKEYIRVIQDFHFKKDFTLTDVDSYQRLWQSYQSPKYIPSCGINLEGKAIGPDGKIYPCESAPLMGDRFSIGDVRNGIDPKISKKVRKSLSKIPMKCEKCDLKCFPCPVCCWINNKEIGSDPEDWYCELKRMQFRVANYFSGQTKRIIQS